ncbi:hypothetical protein AAFF_G00008670 [Aldrovandia affinis]|uniref:Uncharacterized protein n=1 Tax=Aldrovandia affinis TaxID=143900 RepID=A0AAD7X0R4_9TELE|nr:hypothetical protein AAFF_G00008670 [Aldrovandia affinis]
MGVLQTRAQKFHNWTFHHQDPAWPQMCYLLRFTEVWLWVDEDRPLVIERVNLDRFLWTMPYKIKRTVSSGNPKPLDRLVELVETYEATTDLLKVAQPGHPQWMQ